MINLKSFDPIGEGIYVYKNFLSDEEIVYVNNLIDNIEEWQTLPYFENVMQKSEDIEDLSFISIRLRSLLSDGFMLGHNQSITKMSPGNKWGAHADVHDFKEIELLAQEYVEGDDYEEKDLSVYGTVVYFRIPKTGGEIAYPSQGIKYKPEAGDLVIHGSGPDCIHEVLEVVDGIRYSISNHIYKKVRIKKSAS